MSAAASLPFPGSRTLAGWWRQLAPYEPQAMWVGHLFLHRLEALVRVSQPHRLDRFTRLLLQAIALEATSTSAATVAILADRLQLQVALTAQLLRQLAHEGLIDATAEGWRVNARGQDVLNDGEYLRDQEERRVFYFLDPETDPPAQHYVPLQIMNTNSASSEARPFDVRVLQATIEQSPQWKATHGFPLDVRELLQPAAEAALSSWRRVPVALAERLFTALILTPARVFGPALLSFAVRQESWTLLSSAPVLHICRDQHDLFPHLSAPAALEEWRQAWQTWCATRGIAPDAANACTLEWRAARLRVRASPGVHEHLRSTRSEALKRETWLLAGNGSLRAAAALELRAE